MRETKVVVKKEDLFFLYSEIFKNYMCMICVLKMTLSNDKNIQLYIFYYCPCLRT